MKFKVFVSYCSKDLPKINPILDVIKIQNNSDVFCAEHSLIPGDNFDKKIMLNLEDSDLFLIFISKNANNSCYVQQEIGAAKSKNKEIIPILLDGTKPDGMITGLNYLDLSDQKKCEKEMQRLYNSITKKAQTKERNNMIGILGLIGLLFFAIKAEA